MTDWQDPLTVMQDWLSVVKVIHFAAGLYIWEWLMNLAFEWMLLRNIRKQRAPTAIYILCRIMTLGGVITELVGANVTSEINCMAMWRCVMCFGYISLALSSSLIVLRAIAIWNRNIYISVVVVAVYLTNIGFMLHDIVDSAEATWNTLLSTCILSGEVKSKPFNISCAVTDGVLLIIVLVGVLKFKGSGSLWTLIYHQGIIWFVAATFIYIPPAVLVSLNLNDPMNSILQPLTYITMAICASRMHRNLYRFAHHTNIWTSIIASPKLELEFNSSSRNDSSTVPTIPLDRLSRLPAQSQLDSKPNTYEDDGVLRVKSDFPPPGADMV